MTAELAAISGVGASVGVAGAGDGSGGDGVQVGATGTAVAVGGDVASRSSAREMRSAAASEQARDARSRGMANKRERCIHPALTHVLVVAYRRHIESAKIGAAGAPLRRLTAITY